MQVKKELRELEAKYEKGNYFCELECWKKTKLNCPRVQHDPAQGPVSRKSRELFGPEKPFVKLRPAHSVKLVF